MNDGGEETRGKGEAQNSLGRNDVMSLFAS